MRDAIKLARDVCVLPKWRSFSDRLLREWVAWADGWLAGRDRSTSSAQIAARVALQAFEELKANPGACGHDSLRLGYVALAVASAAVSAAQAAAILSASTQALVSRVQAAAAASDQAATRDIIEQIGALNAEADQRIADTVAKAVGAARFAMTESA